MSLPSGLSDRFYKCGMVQASTAGTATAVGATNELVIGNDGSPEANRAAKRLPKLGDTVPKIFELGPTDAVEWEIPIADDFAFDYQGGPLLSAIAAFMGSPTAPAKVGSTTGYTHVWDFADEMTDFFTFVTMRPGLVWEVTNCECRKLLFKLGNGYLQGSLGMRGNQMISTSAVNGETEVEALTPEVADPNFILADHGVFRMNAQGGDALDSGDEIALADFEITMERVSETQRSLGSALFTIPSPEGRPKFNVKLTFSDAGDLAAYAAAFLAETAYKAEFIFTGGVANDTTHYAFKIGFPRLFLASNPKVTLADIIKDGYLELEGLEAAAAPTGMTGHVRPWIEVTNLRTTAYIA